MKKLIVKLKQWKLQWVITDNLDVREDRSRDFLIIPSIEISLPPDGMVEIIKPSFALLLVWGFWGCGVFCIKQKQS